MRISQRLEHDIVLVGAGAAHLQVLRGLAMRPIPNASVTLIADHGEVPYSAMVPRWVAGEVSRDRVCFDLLPLCRAAGVRFLEQSAVSLDRLRREVGLSNGRRVPYDLVSLSLGAAPSVPTWVRPDRVIPLRPLSAFLDRLESLVSPLALAVVGGGATGCELVLALRRRYPNATLRLFHQADRLLPEFPKRAAIAIEKRLQRARIGVEAAGGISADEYVIWATTPDAPSLIRSLDLPKCPEGFLLVDKTLRSLGDARVLASGDCVTYEAYPGLPRNGVQAVRAGPVLLANLRAWAAGLDSRRFRPAKGVLSILNLSDGSGLARRGKWVASGRWALSWKRRIDSRWAEKFRPLDVPREPVEMFCGGCAAKLPAEDLEAVLGGLGEDAAWVEQEGGGIRMESVDFFRAFHDDPRFLGKIAAVHALSDLHAMNCRPVSAQSLVTLPFLLSSSLKVRWLTEILAGAREAFDAEGVALLGGHTSEGAELALGFSVSGQADSARLFLKRGFTPGRVLILTKPLGSGALLAAWALGRMRNPWWRFLAEGLESSNATARRIFAEAGVDAATDITGYGLAGHLLDCLKKSGAGARIETRSLVRYPGFEEVTAEGIRSSLWESNLRGVQRWMSAPPEALPLVCDPQTSGGLLAAVPMGGAGRVLEQLAAAGVTARKIGETFSAKQPTLEFL